MTDFFFCSFQKFFRIKLYVVRQSIGDMNLLTDQIPIGSLSIERFLSIETYIFFSRKSNRLSILLRKFHAPLLDDVGYWMDIISIAIAAQSRSFERYRTPTRKGINNMGHTSKKSCLSLSSCLFQMLYLRMIPMSIRIRIERFFSFFSIFMHAIVLPQKISRRAILIGIMRYKNQLTSNREYLFIVFILPFDH